MELFLAYAFFGCKLTKRMEDWKMIRKQNDDIHHSFCLLQLPYPFILHPLLIVNEFS